VNRALAVEIAGTGSALPSRVVGTAELVAEAFPGSPPEQRARVETKSGIVTRHWLEPGEAALPLGVAALRGALERAGIEARALGRIIFVSSTGGDHVVPANAHQIAGAFGLSDTCDAFDLSNSCVGFLSALDVAARSVATGSGPVAIVAVETFSRQLSPRGPRAYVVLGDAAAAAVVRPIEGRAADGTGAPGGILASCLRSVDRLRGKMSMAWAGSPGARPYHDFDARSSELADSALACIGAAIDDVLQSAAISLSDVDWVVLHQPNGSLYALLLDELGIDRRRTVNVVRDIGSVGAASVPFALDRLLRGATVTAGQRILMASVGAGTAYGAILYQVPS